LVVGQRGGGDGPEQVTAGPASIPDTIVAITDDDRLVELDPLGVERRQVARLADVDAVLGFPPGSGAPDDPQLAVSSDAATAYLTRHVPYIPGCPDADGQLPVIVAVDVATGVPTVVAGGAGPVTVGVTAPAVSPSGALAYVEEVSTQADDGACERQWRIAVRGGGYDESFAWPDQERPPTALSWLDSSDHLLITTGSGEQVSVQAVSVSEDLASFESLDLVAPSAAGSSTGLGIVVAGSAEWAGVSLEDEVWYQPSVDPGPHFEGGMEDFVQPLFELPEGSRPVSVSGASGHEAQRLITEASQRAEQLRALAAELDRQIAEIDAELAAGFVAEAETAQLAARRAKLVQERTEHETRAIDIEVEGDLEAARAQAEQVPAVAVVVSSTGGARSVLVWTGADRALVEIPGIAAAAWSPA
jgi:hypothetical protein